MKPKHVLMVVSLGVAGWLALFGDKTTASGSGIAEPAVRLPTAPATIPAQRVSGPHIRDNRPQAIEQPPVILALQSRETLIGGAHAATPAEGLFVSRNWTPPPPPPPKPAPLPPPSAPPLPFTYLGKKRENGRWEVYLSRNDQTFIVQEQSVIEDTYRVEMIRPPLLSLIYLPLSQMQTLTVGDPE